METMSANIKRFKGSVATAESLSRQRFMCSQVRRQQISPEHEGMDYVNRTGPSRGARV